MNVLSTKELAEKWGVDTSLVLRLARAGRIDRAKRFGNKWMFPIDAKKPIDCRTKKAKSNSDTKLIFRFPNYLNFDEKDYTPSLTRDELQLRKAQFAFQECEFDEAREILVSLIQKVESRYIKIASMYLMLYISMYDNSDNFGSLLTSFRNELEGDYPYKNEMMLLYYRFSSDNGFYEPLLNGLKIEPDYFYHPTAWCELMLASFIVMENGNFALVSHLRFETYEILCQQFQRGGYYLEEQKLHYLLLIVYQLQGNEEKMRFHVRRGLQIARDYKYYYSAAVYQRFYPYPTNEVLKEFDLEFAEKIKSLGKYIDEKMAHFSLKRDNPSYLNLLSGKEYEYAFLANQGFTNGEIAAKLNKSEKTVSRMYSQIYDKLGVKNKKELIDLINKTHGKYNIDG